MGRYVDSQLSLNHSSRKEKAEAAEDDRRKIFETC